MRFVHRANTNKIRLLTFLTPLKFKIMKNPQITTKLNRMMADERKAKIDVIGCILDNYAITKPNIDLNQAFNDLYDLDLYQLNDILSDLISNLYAEINHKLERIKNRN